jgi:signal peptidase II
MNESLMAEKAGWRHWGRGWALVLVVVVVVLDQWTKTLASSLLTYAQPVEILPVFDLTLLHNRGAAFSFLSEAGGWQRWFFSGLAATVSVVLVVWLWRLPRKQWLLSLALALILGGALGNLWDRILLGHVVDFISLHYGGRYFPAFNLADSAITLGAVLMLLDMVINAEKKADEQS